MRQIEEKSPEDFRDDMKKIEVLLGKKGYFRGGRRFILDVPPLSYRKLSKEKLMAAYRKIVKQRLKEKEIGIIKNDELLLYLNIGIKDRYTIRDVDNIAKSIMDSLEGILYKKDRQVKILIVEKDKRTRKLNECLVIAFKILKT